MLIWPKKQNIIKQENLLLHIRMGKEIFTFGNIEIKKKFFYCNETPIFLRVADTEKVLVSNKNSFGEKSYKYFIGQRWYTKRIW